MATCTDGNNTCGTGTGGSCGEEKVYHLLDIDGLKRILSKMRNKLLMAVGTIRLSADKPLNLWKDADDDGITIGGDIDTATSTDVGVVKVREENGLHVTETGDDAGEVFVDIVTRTNPGTLSAEDFGSILDRLTDIEGKLEELTSLTYSAPEVELSYPTDVPAEGGTASPTLTYRQKVTRGDGTVHYLENEGGEISYEPTTGNDMATIDSKTGVVTCTDANLTTSRKTLATVKVTVSMNGATGSATADVCQAAAAEATRTYGELTGSLSYLTDIPAAGGSVSPVLTYSLPWTDTDGNSGTLTSGAVVTYDFKQREADNLDFENDPIINGQTGVVTCGANMFDDRSNIGTVTAHIELEGKTLDLEAYIYQAAGTVEYDQVEITEFSYPEDVPAEGGTANPTLKYRVHYKQSDGQEGWQEYEGAGDYATFELVE